MDKTVGVNDSISILSAFLLPGSAKLPRNCDRLRDIQAKVDALFERDYMISTIKNDANPICSSYPPHIVVIEASLHDEKDDRELETASSLTILAKAAYQARARRRFPVSVLRVRGKNVCRSATLAHELEVFGRQPQLLYTSFLQPKSSSTEKKEVLPDNMIEIRKNDEKLLRALRVSYICDLQVEYQKRKYGLTVASSEKVDPTGFYQHPQYDVVALPYPGCEHFCDFEHGGVYDSNGMQTGFEKGLDVPMTLPLEGLGARAVNYTGAKWDEYKTWDLVTLTKNYFRLMLTMIADGDKDRGLDIHCISGWDRTPMFLSLLRISLWADGEIHTSLNEEEMTYLTLAYDWMLFSHNLYNRKNKGEDIMLFSFHFLKEIIGDEFALPPNGKGWPPSGEEAKEEENTEEEEVVEEKKEVESAEEDAVLVEHCIHTPPPKKRSERLKAVFGVFSEAMAVADPNYYPTKKIMKQSGFWGSVFG